MSNGSPRGCLSSANAQPLSTCEVRLHNLTSWESYLTFAQVLKKVRKDQRRNSIVRVVCISFHNNILETPRSHSGHNCSDYAPCFNRSLGFDSCHPQYGDQGRHQEGDSQRNDDERPPHRLESTRLNAVTGRPSFKPNASPAAPSPAPADFAPGTDLWLPVMVSSTVHANGFQGECMLTLDKYTG